MKRFKSLVTLAGVAGLVLAVSAIPALAVTFSYTQNTGFKFGTATTGTISGGGPTFFGGIGFFGPDGTVADAYRVIGWGCTVGTGSGNAAANCEGGVASTDDNHIAGTDPFTLDNRSSLKLVPFSGSISDDGIPVDITQVLHRNQPIDDDSRVLGTVEIHSLLVLDITPPELSDFSNANIVPISFLETRNRSNIANCNETSNPLGSGCDDIFSVTDISSFGPEFFQAGGKTYKLEFGLRPPCGNFIGSVGSVDVFECDLGEGPVKLGIDFANLIVYAAEGEESSLFITMRMTQVPAPWSLGLLGLGLAGLAVAGIARRRSA